MAPGPGARRGAIDPGRRIPSNGRKLPTRTSEGPSISWSGAGAPDAAPRFTLRLDAVGNRAAQRLRAPLPPVATTDVRRQLPRALARDHARGAQHGAAGSGRDSGEGAVRVRLAGPVFCDPSVEWQIDAGAPCGRVRGPAALAVGGAGEDRDGENHEHLHGPTMQRPDSVSQLRPASSPAHFRRTPGPIRRVLPTRGVLPAL